MIRPTKYMDLNTSVLNVAAVVLVELRKYRALPLDELSEIISARVNKTAVFNLFPALSFLYLTGKIEYDDEADAVFYLLERAGVIR